MFAVRYEHNCSIIKQVNIIITIINYNAHYLYPVQNSATTLSNSGTHRNHSNKWQAISLPHHKIVHPPCCYYWSHENENHDVELPFNVITFIHNFITISPLIHNWNTEIAPGFHKNLLFFHRQRKHSKCVSTVTYSIVKRLKYGTTPFRKTKGGIFANQVSFGTNNVQVCH
jgi:hypothetical protein